MKWIPDETGRFNYRPYYDSKEIDADCDALITDFLQKKYGSIKLPLPVRTEDLEVLLEIHTSDFDPYADLSNEGDEIEGVTYFLPKSEPVVKISKELSVKYWQENRRRTTLSHELGHVMFHSKILSRNNLQLSEADNQSFLPIRCNRQNVSAAKKKDWLEWQAYYASGAYLMPVFHISKLADEIFDLLKLKGPFLVSSSAGYGFISRVIHSCKISKSAAIVRLIQLGYLTENEAIATVY
jgi:hypothetical protein